MPSPLKSGGWGPLTCSCTDSYSVCMLRWGGRDGVWPSVADWYLGLSFPRPTASVVLRILQHMSPAVSWGADPRSNSCYPGKLPGGCLHLSITYWAQSSCVRQVCCGQVKGKRYKPTENIQASKGVNLAIHLSTQPSSHRHSKYFLISHYPCTRLCLGTVGKGRRERGRGHEWGHQGW